MAFLEFIHTNRLRAKKPILRVPTMASLSSGTGAKALRGHPSEKSLSESFENIRDERERSYTSTRGIFCRTRPLAVLVLQLYNLKPIPTISPPVDPVYLTVNTDFLRTVVGPFLCRSRLFGLAVVVVSHTSSSGSGFQGEQ